MEDLALRLYELTKDMDAMDYIENKEDELHDLEEALYQLKAIAQNEYNNDYWRTLWNAIQML